MVRVLRTVPPSPASKYLGLSVCLSHDTQSAINYLPIIIIPYHRYLSSQLWETKGEEPPGHFVILIGMAASFDGHEKVTKGQNQAI